MPPGPASPNLRRQAVTACALLLFALACALFLAGCRGGDPAALLSEARKLRAQGDARGAIAALRQSLHSQPADAAALRLLGELYLEQGNAGAAEQALTRASPAGAEPGPELSMLLLRAWLMQGQFERVLSANPAAMPPALLPPMLALRGHALLGMAQTEAARAAFEHALQLHADQPEALQGLARIAIAAGRTDDAATLLLRALAANPGHMECLRLHAALLRAKGETALALATFGKILELHPHSLPTQLDMINLLLDADRFKEARAALAAARDQAGPLLPVVYTEALADYRERHFQSALTALQSILRSDPGHEAATLLAGAVHAALGNAQEASSHVRSYLARHPSHLLASKLMAGLHVRAQQPGTALALLEPLAEAHPQDAELLILSGEAQLLARQYASAAMLFARASALRPAAAPLRLTLALSHMGTGDSARALAELERAAHIDPDGQRIVMLLVMSHLRGGDHAQAMAVASAFEQRGDSPLIQNLKGGIFLAAQDVRAARGCFNRALVLEPLYLPALANLARLDLLDGQGGRARQRYENALARSPANSALMEALADIALQQSQRGAALGWLERAHRAAPNSLPLALRLASLYADSGAAAKGLLLARKLHGAHPASEPALATLARIQSMQRQHADALSSYARLAALAPGAALPHVQSATLRVAMDDPDGALQSLRRALLLDPELAEAQQAMLAILLRQKRYTDAQALVLSVQRRQPGSATGFKLDGDLLLAQGQPGPALKAYEQAFSLHPDGKVLTAIHGALRQAGRGAEGDARLEAWLQAHPSDVPTRLYLASSQLLASQERAAIGHFRHVLKAEPDNIVALNDMAWASQLLHEPDALEHAERAHALAPDNPVVMDTLGWILLGEGQLERALPLLRKASALAPQAGAIRLHLGTVLARSGDKQAARRELQALLASPQQTPVREQAEALLASL